MISTLANGTLRVVTSTKGAELLSVTCGKREYMWQGNEKYWDYHAPILFPYVGRLTENKYSYNGRYYEMMIHGFAMEEDFSVIEVSDKSITYELQDNSEMYAMFPFHFTLRVSYTIVSSKIEIQYMILNDSDEIMHFGIGAHPGFNVPLEEDLDFEDYYIRFPSGSNPDRIVFSDNVLLERMREPYILENSCIKLQHNLFDNDAIVLENMGSHVSLESLKGERKIIINYPHMPYLGIWHANKTRAPYVCIEPWASLPSREGVFEDISCKSDLIHLLGREQYTNKWSIEFV